MSHMSCWVSNTTASGTQINSKSKYYWHFPSTSLMSSICCSRSAKRLRLSSSSRRASCVSDRSSSSSMIFRISLRPLGVPLGLGSSLISSSWSLYTNQQHSQRKWERKKKTQEHLSASLRHNIYKKLNRLSINCYLFCTGVRQPNAGPLRIVFKTTSFFDFLHFNSGKIKMVKIHLQFVF